VALMLRRSATCRIAEIASRTLLNLAQQAMYQILDFYIGGSAIGIP
jgi:hypothetical protein